MEETEEEVEIYGALGLSAIQRRVLCKPAGGAPFGFRQVLGGPSCALFEKGGLSRMRTAGARQRCGFVVVGYVVMPDHIHLLISEPERGRPSTLMQVVKQRYQRVVKVQRNIQRLKAQ